MLFNSYTFLLAFLPLSLLGYLLASRLGPRASLAWLAFCSLFFYGYWNPAFLILILGSITINYSAGHLIGHPKLAAQKQAIFVAAIVANLMLLGIFKYLGPLVNFFAQYGAWKAHLDIILPLGISFFTFTQIGYLADRRDGIGEDMDALRYTVFVTFFPHLVAGPILHIREIGPQLHDRLALRLRADSFAPGLTMFAIGLAKKVLLADPLGTIANIGFPHAHSLSLLEGWTTALAYMAELYFDFSGYSDMAIGLAAMFGIRFPLNFNSPYKSRSIIEFWQRFHMTLSRYLALLLYNPIAIWITRRRVARGLKVSHKALKQPWVFGSMIAFPTFCTMGLAGIWHGAGLQYLVFGLLHAAYLTTNHAWRIFPGKTQAIGEKPSLLTILWQVALTQLAVMVALVFFRSTSCTAALQILASLVGAHGLSLPAPAVAHLANLGAAGRLIAAHISARSALPIVGGSNILRIVLSFALIWLAPNSQQILGDYAPILEKSQPCAPRWLQWRPDFPHGAAVALMLWISFMNVTQSTTFLYFQF